MSVFRINLRQLFDNAFFISCHRTSIIVFMRVHDVIFSEMEKDTTAGPQEQTLD